MRRVNQGLLVLAMILLPVAVIPATSAASTIKVKTTIGAAIAAASPGDTIVVPPGKYHEGDLLVTKDNLTIRGSKAAVLDASGHEFGIRVGAGSISGDPPVCPSLSVNHFTLRGMTIKNADDTGLFMIGVDGFHVTRWALSRQRGIRSLSALLARRPHRPQLGGRRKGRHRVRRRRRQRHGHEEPPQ